MQGIKQLNPGYLSATVLLLNMLFTPIASAELAPVYFSDCAYIDLGEIDGRKLTRKEKIQALENDLFDSLNKTEDCMTTAANSGAQAIANAGQTGTGSSGSQNGESAAQEQRQASQQAAARAEQAEQTDPNTPQQPSQRNNEVKTRSATGGPSSGGSSSVCDAINAGLKSASTDQEKEHFNKLKRQYGC